MNPIDTLMHEHRFIEKVIDSLVRYTDRLEGGDDAPREDLAQFAGFLRTFADTCHHGKEEDILFRTMNERGMPAEMGPIAVMLGEHELGRSHVKALAELGAGVGPFSDAEKTRVVETARGYAHLLRDHIMKEDNVLYPMALDLLSPEDIEKMAERFLAFEADEMGEGTHERIHAGAEELVARYPAAAPPTSH
jgi:hemerythrin-like domain-containing protein